MTPSLGIMASSFRSAAGPVGAYDSLATVTLSAATASITFAGIPSGYKHLQIRAMHINTAQSDAKINFNSDTSANYSRHGIYGQGVTPSVGVYGIANETFIPFGYPYSTTNPCVSIIDILDYSNTNKYKTVRALHGNDTNGDGIISLVSGNWRNTAAVTSIVLSNGSGNFSQHSSFALYGVN